MTTGFLTADTSDADALLDEDASDVLDALWDAPAADELAAAYGESSGIDRATAVTTHLATLPAGRAAIGDLISRSDGLDGADRVLRELRQWFKQQIASPTERLLPRRVCWVMYLGVVASALRSNILDPVRQAPMTKTPRGEIARQLDQVAREPWLPDRVQAVLQEHASALKAAG